MREILTSVRLAAAGTAAWPNTCSSVKPPYRRQLNGKVVFRPILNGKLVACHAAAFYCESGANRRTACPNAETVNVSGYIFS